MMEVITTFGPWAIDMFMAFIAGAIVGGHWTVRRMTR